MRPLITTVFGLAVIIAIAGQAFADAGKAKSGEKFDRVGTLSTGRVKIGGETTGITLKTDDGVYELSLFGELARKAQTLDGKKVHVIGVLNIVAGEEVKERRIVAVEWLTEAKPK